MSTDIYYFTGTGNSLAVARDIASRIDGKLLSIPSLMDNEIVTTDAEAIGLVFPVHHKGIPLILKRFVGKIENLENRYIFAIYTYGDTPGRGVRRLSQLIEARGGELAAGFGVHMPYNYLTPSFVLRNYLSSFTLREIPYEKQHALFALAPKRIESIAEFVSAGMSGTFEITSDAHNLLGKEVCL